MGEGKPKFVVLQDNTFKMGTVMYHSQLGTEENKPIGGGLWYLSDNKTKLVCYGLSTDFGPVTKDQLVNAIKSTKLTGDLETVKKIYLAPYSAMTVLEANLQAELIHQVD